MEVQELRPGLWRWTARHPAWEPAEGLPAQVGSVYCETPGAVVLVDPLVPVGEEDRFWAALDRDVERLARPVLVLLTVPWHERSAEAIVSRYDGVIADEPPGKTVEAIRISGVGGEPETIFWLPEARALMFGDVLAGSPPRVMDSWLPEDRRGAPIRSDLERLLDLPVELLLPSHGAAVRERAREALESALRV